MTRRTSKRKYTINCPVCSCKWTDIDQAGSVCGKHASWFVTECIECGWIVLSNFQGWCIDCQLDADKSAGKDHAQLLIKQYNLPVHYRHDPQIPENRLEDV